MTGWFCASLKSGKNADSGLRRAATGRMGSVIAGIAGWTPPISAASAGADLLVEKRHVAVWHQVCDSTPQLLMAHMELRRAHRRDLLHAEHNALVS